MIEAVYILFVSSDNKVLMHKRTRGYGKGCYSPPGGHVEPYDKDAIACVMREADEEVGHDVKIDPASISLYHTQFRLSSDSDQTRTNSYYIVRNWTGEPIIAELDKAEDLRWFNMADLPYDHMMSDVANALKSKQAGRDFSIDGFPDGDQRGIEWLKERVSAPKTIIKSPLNLR